MNAVITTQKVEALTPYAQNARTHDEEHIAQIAASIRQFGFTNPVLVDPNREIIAGHGRVLAAKKLGLSEVPTIEIAHLTDDQKRAYVLADNKLALNAGWDEELLSKELSELLQKNFDVAVTGFSEKEIRSLVGLETTDGLTEEDAVPEVPEVAKTQPGDIYTLGDHRLMCGDSTSRDNMERLMDGHHADMVFTDPPYNVEYGERQNIGKWKVRPMKNDNLSADSHAEFCTQFIQNIRTFCNGCVYVFGASGMDGRRMFTLLDDMLHYSTVIIWNKDRFTLGRGKYQNKYEPCWFGWNESGATFLDDRNLDNVWDIPRPTASALHPTMKPVELIETALSHASNVGGRVLDLFGGSGSTLIACEKTRRVANLMELDPKYCDVIVERWEGFTGREATRG